ncbi:ly6/PLAUR domain-containing protein 8 isoform X3 [Pseudorca crassidens]|uniref:ly6/PLAUR domain-containing protein 8 isoform X3 n=1 Tax=Pseudorca crassidens TaxID=82174 RepID=UPI00352C5006
MKGFLFAGIIVMLTVAAVESLSCVQCNSLTDPCFDGNAIECPANASISCTTFLTNFSLGENITWYEDKACSADNCSVAETFTVHVSANETFHFASQCCQGKACNDTNDTIEMKLVLKGCSNVSNSTCEFLATGNRTVGGVTFLKFECENSSDASSTPTPTPPSSTSDTGSKVFFTPLTLGSLLLLRLLL